MAFGKYIKNVLEKEKKSVWWLSDVSGVPKSTIYGMIKRDSNPDFNAMKKILDAFQKHNPDYINTPDNGKKFSTQELEYKALLTKVNTLKHLNAWKDENNYRYAQNWITLTKGLSKKQIKQLMEYADFLRSQHNTEKD